MGHVTLGKFGREYPVMTGSVLFNPGNTGKERLDVIKDSLYRQLYNTYLYDYPVKTSFEDSYTEMVVFLTDRGQVLYLPGRHIPIDTSLCSQSPQVRIYGFVAAGITPSRANKEDETHKTWRQQVILLSDPVKSTQQTTPFSGRSSKRATKNNDDIFHFILEI